jgi:hypothetical protein
MSLYTHKISWNENHPEYGTLTKSFRTTEDAIPAHLERLLKSDTAFNIHWEQLPLVECIARIEQLKNYFPKHEN